LPSFGEKLRLEREKRKITIDEISSSTKISTRMLHALEEDKFNQLPGGIFNKGFVRAYARVVGIDEDQAVADYLHASGDAPPVRPEISGREDARDNAHAPAARDADEGRLEIRAEVASRQLPWGVFAAVLLIIALALSLWSHRRREQQRLATQTPAVTASQQSSEASSPQSNAVSSTGSPAATPVQLTPSRPTPPAAAKAKTPSPSTQNPPTPAALTAPISTGEFTLVIQARDESWLSVTVDGKSTGSELLEPGSERTIHARKEVVVKAGNVGGVDFQLNGKKLAVGGDYGEVKTVTIGPAGLVSATSVPPPAPQP